MTTTADPAAMNNPEPTGTRPFSAFEWLMALRYLRARRKERFISVIAVISFLSFAIGVFALIVILAVMNGLRADLQDKILGFKGHVEVTAKDGPFADFAVVAERLSRVPEVRLAVPFVEGQALSSSRYNAGGVFVRGLRPEDAKRLPGLAENVREGSFDLFDAGEGAMIGMGLATQLGMQAGDTIMLLAPSKETRTRGTPPRSRGFPISGAYEIGHSDIDSNFVIIPLAAAQDYFDRAGDVTGIEVYVKDPLAMAAAKAAIAQAAGRPVTLTDWTERDKTLFNALVVERNVMFVILVLIVVVAAFNIISSLIMMVRDKSSDIAVLRTMGATRGAVMRIFMITGTAIGVSGILAGAAGGLAFAANIDNLRGFVEGQFQTGLFPSWLSFLTRLPAKINPDEVAVVVIAALVTALAATIYPALRAARLEPVEALRYE